MKIDKRLAFRRRLGDRLRLLRREKGKTKVDVAAALDCTVQNVDGIERGDWGTDASNLPALAELFGVSLNEILGDPDAK